MTDNHLLNFSSHKSSIACGYLLYYSEIAVTLTEIIVIIPIINSDINYKLYAFVLTFYSDIVVLIKALLTLSKFLSSSLDPNFLGQTFLLVKKIILFLS